MALHECIRARLDQNDLAQHQSNIASMSKLGAQPVANERMMRGNALFTGRMYASRAGPKTSGKTPGQNSQHEQAR